MLGFATKLSIAEVYYVRGWRMQNVSSEIAELQHAAELYPYLPRFREAAALRYRLFAQRGI
jgi:hypothetical protein